MRADNTADVAVVGAGIVGIAHALAAARTGRSVVVFERRSQAQGASVRNFGMVWPVGQRPGGDAHEIALRSRDIWCDVAARAGLWHLECGSLHLAYADDELAVLSEFIDTATSRGAACRLVDASETLDLSPSVRSEGLRGALWSPTEVCVDPREAIAKIPLWQQAELGVDFRFATTVVGVEHPLVHTAAGESWHADHIIVCGGDDLETLYPEILATAGLRRCKLQMMRTSAQPDGWRLGPLLAGGLTLRHYPAFEDCPSLPVLTARIRDENPAYDAYGVHVMASQTGRGEITIGDSHVYGDDPGPFDLAEIDALVMDYLRRFLSVPHLDIAERWHGVYAKTGDGSFAFVHEPEAGVRIVTGLGGAGMTLAFGTAERVVAGLG